MRCPPASGASRDSRGWGARTCGSSPIPRSPRRQHGRGDRARDPRCSSAPDEERGLADAWRLLGEAQMYEGRASDGQRALEQALRARRSRDRCRGTGTRSPSRRGCACWTARPTWTARPSSPRSIWPPRARAACARWRPTCCTCSARASARQGALRRGARGAVGVHGDQRGHGPALHVAVVQAQPRAHGAGGRRRGGGRARAARELGRAHADGPAELPGRDRGAAGRGAVCAGPLRGGGRDA